MLVYAAVVNYHSTYPTRAERCYILHRWFSRFPIPDKHLARRIKSNVLVALELSQFYSFVYHFVSLYSAVAHALNVSTHAARFPVCRLLHCCFAGQKSQRMCE